MEWRFVVGLAVVAVHVVACGSGEPSDAPATPTVPDAGLGQAPIDAGGNPGTPHITSFAAAKDKVTLGKPTALTAEFTGGAGVIDNGIGPVTSGITVATSPLAADTKYTLTVTATGGATATRTITVSAFAAPTIASFAAVKPTITKGKPASLVGVFNGTGTVDNGVGAIVSNVPTATGNLAASTVFTLTVANEAGDTVTKTADVTAVDPPTITSFTATSAKVSRNTPAELTAVFSGGTGAIDNGVGAVTSGNAVTTANLATSTTFTLTVTNAAEDAATQQVTVATKKEIFVPTWQSNAIAVFDDDASGNVAPKRRIVGAATLLGTPLSVWAAGSELVVGGASRVSVFNVTDAGDVAPKRSLTGASTGLATPYGVLVNGTELFVSNYTGTSIGVFNLTDTGDVAPKRQLGGANAGLAGPLFSVVDGTELFVPNYPSAGVRVFNVTDAGNVAPKRTFALASVIGVDVAGNELVATSPKAITVVDKTTGAQIRQITGASTGMGDQYKCVVVGTELYCNDVSGNRIAIFPLAGNGDIAPTRVIAGGATTLLGPGAIFVY